MDESLRQQILAAGVDADKIMKRFMGNWNHALSFLRKFPGDDNYKNMVTGLETGEYELAFRSCHNLKGLCGNLALTELQAVVAEQTELLRAKKWEEAKVMLPRVTEAYQSTLEKLAPLLELK